MPMPGLGINDDGNNDNKDPEHELWKKFIIGAVVVLVIALVIMFIADSNRKTHQQEVDEWSKALGAPDYSLVYAMK